MLVTRRRGRRSYDRVGRYCNTSLWRQGHNRFPQGATRGHQPQALEVTERLIKWNIERIFHLPWQNRDAPSILKWRSRNLLFPLFLPRPSVSHSPNHLFRKPKTGEDVKQAAPAIEWLLLVVRKVTLFTDNGLLCKWYRTHINWVRWQNIPPSVVCKFQAVFPATRGKHLWRWVRRMRRRSEPSSYRTGRHMENWHTIELNTQLHNWVKDHWHTMNGRVVGLRSGEEEEEEDMCSKWTRMSLAYREDREGRVLGDQAIKLIFNRISNQIILLILE